MYQVVSFERAADGECYVVNVIARAVPTESRASNLMKSCNAMNKLFGGVRGHGYFPDERNLMGAKIKYRSD